MTTTRRAQVIGPEDGDVLGPPGGSQDRFLVDGDGTGGIALVEHRLGPRALAGPMHRHSREDEFSIVLAGQVGAVLGDREVVAGPGCVVVKPRGQWHTFWNAGDEPARLIEVLSPGGLERLFRRLDVLDEWPSGDELADLAGRYGCDVDLGATAVLPERHGLSS
jgi:mannose-6-phosphate isomerase-like protein (cupin superfamily)